MTFTAQQFDQTLKALQYIEDHLTDPICMEDISTHVSYSLYHFSRVFNTVTMISPYTYLMRRRISEAANQVIRTPRRLTDIAMDFGFQSSEVFSRSFRRVFNAAPSELRKQKYVDSRLLLPAVTAEHLRDWQRFRTIQLQKDEWPLCRAFGIQNRCASPGTALAQMQLEMRQQYPSSKSESCLSVLYFPAQWESHGNYIFSGFQSEHSPDDLPPWFVEKKIPAQFVLSTKSTIPIADIPAYLAYLSAVWFPISSYQPVYTNVICVFHNGLTSVKLYIAAYSKVDNHVHSGGKNAPDTK